MNGYDVPRPLYGLFIIASAVCGAVMGSFLNCWAMRLEAGEKLPRGRSRCPKCGRVLGPAELVPVLSWLVQRGRCRGCGERISLRYPMTELTTALFFTLAFVGRGVSWGTPELWCLFGALLMLAVTDLDTMELPDGMMIYGLAVFLVFLPSHTEPLRRLWTGAVTGLVLGGAVLAVSLVMDRIMGRETLGGGDIKLLALMGLWLGPVKSILALLLACLAGIVTMAAMGRKGKPFPFGPALCFALAITLLYGDAAAEWYMGLL